MMNVKIVLLGVLLSLPFILGVDNNIVFAQTEINVTESTPCFLNYTAGADMWDNCGFDEDFLGAALLPFEWVTGGIFSMIIVVLIIVMSYVKYRTVIYPIAIGIMFLPISWFVFPEVFLSYAIILAGVGIAGLIYTALVLRTKDY